MSMRVDLRERSDVALGAEAAYDLAAPLYDGWKWQGFWRGTELPFIERGLGELTSAPPRLLDIGCGTGWYLGRLKRLCRETTGVDVSSGMLALARRQAADSVLLQADAEHLPFDDGRFDAVLSTRVLSHLASPRVALAEMARMLPLGGLAVLSNVDASHRYERTRLPAPGGHVCADTHKHTRTALEADLLAAGFEHRRSLLIEDREGATPVARLSERVDRPIAGWITAWIRTGRVCSAF